MSKKFIFLTSVISIVIGSIFIANYMIWAYTNPIGAPPTGNIAAPLNVGPIGQAKRGGLILNTGGAVDGLVIQNGRVIVNNKIYMNDETEVTDSNNTVATKGYVDAKCVVVCTDTCASLGYQCGTHLICGVNTNCGSCPGGQTCNGIGRCVASCTDTCASLGYQCGTHLICGVNTVCGPNSQSCGTDTGSCTKGTQTCTNGFWELCSGVPPVSGFVTVPYNGSWDANCDGKVEHQWNSMTYGGACTYSIDCNVDDKYWADPYVSPSCGFSGNWCNQIQCDFIPALNKVGCNCNRTESRLAGCR